MARKAAIPWTAIAVVAAVIAHACYGDILRRAFGLGGRPVIRGPGSNLRVATWNLRNFPRETKDRGRVRDNILGLQTDLLAVQEVRDPKLLRGLVPEWEFHLSERGGRGHQLLGVGFDPAKIEVVSPLREHAELELGGRVRPAVSLRVRSRRTEIEFSVVVVHLKARPQGFEKRREQWPALAGVIAGVVAEAGDDNVIVLGDFNLTGPPGGVPAAEQTQLESVLRITQGTDLRLVPNDEGCSAYWEGGRRDRWKEPSLLDLIWVGGFDHRVVDNLGRSYAHCARHRCRPFRADEAYPDLDLEGASDHCPVAIDLMPDLEVGQ